MDKKSLWVGFLMLVAVAFGAPENATAANITILDDDINGVQIIPDSNFEYGVNVVQNSFEDATLNGSWIANSGATGSGVIYLVEPGTTTLSDILSAVWTSDNPGGRSIAAITLNFESDVDGVLESGRTIPQLFLDNGWYLEETGSLMGMNNYFRDNITGASVYLPTNLTIYASSDIEPIPEPSTFLLLGGGLIGLGFVVRRKRKE